VLLFTDLGPRATMLARLGDEHLARLGACLAPLSATSAEGAARLKLSLACYLRHDCSLAETASELGLHRNTLGKRLARCERLLGVDLATVDDLVDVQLALDAERVLRSRRAAGEL
jgi:purine catabolism regulator